MDKPGLTRNVIQIISRHSNWPAAGVNKAFEDHVYADKSSWARFIDLVLLGVGAAFCLSGVIFFFAYNWDDLHKFVKLGMVQGLIVAAVTASLLVKQPLIKNILLTAAAVLTGVLFAVFGQIYQTGANSYDLFLGWTVFITLWALVSNFAPLWLIWLVLLNATIVFYREQVANHWDDNSYYLLLAALNTGFVVLYKVLLYEDKLKADNGWFNNIVSLGAAGWITIGMWAGINYRTVDTDFWLLTLLLLLAYGGAIYYAFKNKKLFYCCIIPLSILIILISLIFRVFNLNSSEQLFMLSVFIIAYISITVKLLLNLKKHWDGNK